MEGVMTACLRATARSGPDVVPSHDLLRRVMGEYDEMPSLRLTPPQAMRLWGLDRAMCDAVLRVLSDAHCLRRDEAGQFFKVHADY